MTGDVWISSFATCRSSGGGGGGSAAALAVDGGAGGGGGGTIELSAPGPIEVGAITANGGNGLDGGGGNLPGDGGAGTGGTVLIRTGAMLTASTVTVNPGTPAPGTGGTSSVGRVRVDAAAGDVPGSATIGPMFVGVPTHVTTATPMLELRGTINDDTSTLRVFDPVGNAVAGASYKPVFGINGMAQVTPTLAPGYNKVCVWVAGGAPTVPESVNCVTIAYLPPAS